MNRAKLLSAIALGVVAVGVTLKDYVTVVKTEKETRRKIVENSDRTIESMRIASALIHERIERGDYDGKKFQDIMNDFDFETIVQYNKERPS